MVQIFEEKIWVCNNDNKVSTCRVSRIKEKDLACTGITLPFSMYGRVHFAPSCSSRSAPFFFNGYNRVSLVTVYTSTVPGTWEVVSALLFCEGDRADFGHF